jgi:hypothetical protein
MTKSKGLTGETMTDTLAPDEEEQLAERIFRNQLRISELQEENDTLKTYFKKNATIFPAGTNKTFGKFYVKITSNSRVDDALAKANLTINTYKRFAKTVIDGAAAKRGLDPNTYAKIIKKYDNKVEVGLN